MPKKKTTAHHWTDTQARKAYERLASLTGQAARTTRHIVNPCHDRRCRYGWHLDSAPEVIPAGTLVLVKSVADGWRLTFGTTTKKLGKDGVTRERETYATLEFLLITINGQNAAHPGGNDEEKAVTSVMLDSLGAPEYSWDALLARRESLGRNSAWGERTLRHLVASGRLTLADVEAAANAADDAADDVE
jgi:hypothetical protein